MMNNPAPRRIVVCLLTGASRGAVATVAVDGQGVGELLGQCFEPAGAGPIRMGQVRYGLWHGGYDRGATAESVVVTRHPDRIGPDQKYAESWEIHCHGGVVAAGRILEDLRRCGAGVVSAGRWLQWRAEPLLMREAVDVLSRTTSARTAEIALDQVREAMTKFVDQAWRLLSDDGDERVARVSAAAAQRLRFAAVGLHLDRPWRVVLAGPPNVGKSSLINAILGYRRSITLDQPGTTRDVVDAQTAIEGWPIRLSDTAGIHDAAQCEIESAGIALARREVGQADLVLWIADARTRAIAPPVDRSRNETSHDNQAPRVIEVINKIDLLGPAVPEPAGCVATSAMTGQGIDELRLQIAAALVAEVPPPGAAVPITTRQVECLRRLAAAGDEASAHAALAALAEGDSGSAASS